MSGDRRRRGPSYPLGFVNLNLGWGDVPQSVAPYVPTPPIVVRDMLKLSGACPDDVLYDLGCGDGRILFAAVEEFGVKRAVGYDLNATMCEAVQVKIDERGLGDRIKVVNGNFFNADLTPATLVTLYLTTSGNSKLRPKMENELRKGARVVSHDFQVRDWATVKVDPPLHYSVGSHKVFVYSVPDAYEREMSVPRTWEEASRWERIRALFIRDLEPSEGA